MNNEKGYRHPLRGKLFNKLVGYSQQAARLGRRVRQLVFGFGLRSTAHSDRWALPVKILHDHRVPQRRRAFLKGGGIRSSAAQHALNKVRRDKQ
jgi:hypothetical protein